MKPTKTAEQKSARASHRFHLNVKEAFLLICIGVLAGLAIYTTRDDHTAFGLVDSIAYAQSQPVVVQFRTEVLTGKQLLQMKAMGERSGATQVRARIADPTTPPKIDSVTVLNTRVGGELAVFWELPVGIETARVYRTPENGSEDVVAASVAGEYFLDDTVKNGTRYTYRVVSIATDGTQEYEAKESSSASGIAADQLQPQSPTNVIVTPVVVENQHAMEVTWQNPSDADADHSVVYRSEAVGVRGTEVASIAADKPSTYTDTSVKPNVEYYYTVVAVDAAGNASANDFSEPTTGNPNPFEPL